VGIEIDYKNSTPPPHRALQTFIDIVPVVLPTTRRARTGGRSHRPRRRRPVAHRLTRKATATGLRTTPRSSTTPTRWSRPSSRRCRPPSPTGRKPGRQVQLNPPNPAAGPAKFTAASTSPKAARSTGVHQLQRLAAELQPEVACRARPAGPHPSGMLGYMFWPRRSRPPRRHHRRRTPARAASASPRLTNPHPMPALRQSMKRPVALTADQPRPCCWPSVSVASRGDGPARTPTTSCFGEPHSRLLRGEPQLVDGDSGMTAARRRGKDKPAGAPTTQVWPAASRSARGQQPAPGMGRQTVVDPSRRLGAGHRVRPNAPTPTC